MKIHSDFIPKSKDIEITFIQITKIIDSLYEPHTVSVSEVELPKFISSYNKTEYENREFTGRLIRVKDGKALFEPKPNERDKIKAFDEIKKIEEKLHRLREKQSELKKIDINDRDIKIQEVVNLFDEVFYNKPITTKKLLSKPQRKPIENLLECDLTPYEIELLLPYFKYFFECTESQVINFLSDNITTQIQIKKKIQIKEVVFFLDWLRDHKRIIKTRKLGTVIENSKCIKLSNGDLLTSQKIADGRQGYIKKFVREETQLFLYNNK